MRLRAASDKAREALYSKNAYPRRSTSQLKFVDLFAGLGGFHQALDGLGHKCVFACELDSDLRSLYKKNFSLEPAGDIRAVYRTVPPHDILCAGFPCQPFSKAGEQKGFQCPDSGDLFRYVMKIIKAKQPRYVILENVPNLIRHDQGKTWESMRKRLVRAGYTVDVATLSPHSFGIPQIRQRIIIVAALEGLNHFSFPTATHKVSDLKIHGILDNSPLEAKPIASKYIAYLDAWQSFLQRIPADKPLPSFPIWAMEFGANYPLDQTPSSMPPEALAKYRGIFGCRLSGKTHNQMMELLPRYAQDQSATFPDWKVKFIQQNRDFYVQHKTDIDPWLPSISSFPPSFQKFEWNWKNGPRDIWKTIVQFRSSGIRVKKPESTPSLVALTTSQVPVIAWERRYMTFRECARLQSMENLKYLPESQTGAYRALGNAVNVTVITKVAERLIRA